MTRRDAVFANESSLTWVEAVVCGRLEDGVKDDGDIGRPRTIVPMLEMTISLYEGLISNGVGRKQMLSRTEPKSNSIDTDNSQKLPS